MTAPATPLTLLLADDDADDREMTAEALRESRLANDLHFVHDGQDLLDYLRCEGIHSVPGVAPRPALILLDLNMPRMDGREALQEIKADADLRSIPVVVLTTSKAEEDIYRIYDLSAASYITKPVTFTALVEVLAVWSQYWFKIVELPTPPGG